MHPVNAPPRYRRFTVADYRALPDGSPRYQLIRGSLVMAPAPNRYHQEIVGNLFHVLTEWIRKQDLGKLYVAPFDVYLTQIDVYQPDLVYFSPDRLHHLTDAGADGPPDLVVEVLSPRTAQIDREVKREIYARTGVRELWIVDPDDRVIEAYALQTDATAPARTVSAGDVLTTPLLPEMTLPVDRVFEE